MSKKMIVLVAIGLLAIGVVIGYLLLPRVRPWVGAERFAIPKRKPSQPFRALERHPSAGLAWSKAQYPEQYRPENLKTEEFVVLKLTDREAERFMDVGGRGYSRAFLGSFSYTDPSAARPKVAIEYLARAETFVGRVKASGLKPNFAYQVKLRGKYTEDPEGFEGIGYTGRWRLPGRGTNYTDKDYQEYPYKERVEAYLLFDFVVTDSEGNAEKEFYADSTLHVLWNASTQRGPHRADGAQVPFFRANRRSEFYAHPHPDLRTQRLYAESEQHARGKDNRKPIGQAFLPPGEYKAEVVLTEESFHGYGDAGFWATVMSAPVEFEVTDKPRPGPAAENVSEVRLHAPLSLKGAAFSDIALSVHADDWIEGVATTNDSRIVFPEALELPPGRRYVFAAEIAVHGQHTWQLFIDVGEGFEIRPTYSITTSGHSGWQRFEVEITSMVQGHPARFRLDPATLEGGIGVRMPGIYTVRYPEAMRSLK